MMPVRKLGIFSLKSLSFSFFVFVFPVCAESVYSDLPPLISDLPTFTPDSKPIGNLLPKIDISVHSNGQNINYGDTFILKEFQFNGNQVISDFQLNDMVKNYKNQSISISHLYKIRDQITQAYIKKGYINSGATLPNQDINNGVVHFNIIEGKLFDLKVVTDGRLNQNYISTPLKYSINPVINIFSIEERLQLLQQDIRISKIDAKLEPTAIQGEAILHVSVKENLPYDFRVELNNYASPNVGAEGIKLSAQHDNLTGSGNQLIGNFIKTEGVSRFSLNYSQPLQKKSGSDTRVEVFTSLSESVIVDDNFKDLDIKDQSQTYRLSLRDSKITTINNRYEWFIAGYYQSGATFLKGEPLSFGDPRDDGEIDLIGLSFGADWKLRFKKQVLVIGLSSSIGIPIPDDDDDDEDDVVIDPNGPNGKSLIINSHLQWARKLDFLNARFFSRFDFQLSDSALYGVQQFSLGGHSSVRGYRENLLVRDNGALGSMELRIPVFIKSGTKISTVLFVDGGRAWQTGRENNGPRTIASIGTGLLGTINKKINFNLILAKALRKIDSLGESNIQDQGIHFSISSQWR